jgi:hypothetical protein
MQICPSEHRLDGVLEGAGRDTERDRSVMAAFNYSTWVIGVERWKCDGPSKC